MKKQQIIDNYKTFCNSKNIKFEINENVISPDNTTLFCSSGMQKHKNLFSDVDYKETIADIQSCIRLNDVNEIGDGTHLLYFNMIGLFSFRQMSMKDAVDFFIEWLSTIGIIPDYLTIHPDKEEWKQLSSNIEFKYDDECIWSDGNIGGYCLEFYKDGIEIGNIVNTLGTCIDTGFGLERIEMILNKSKQENDEEILEETILKIINSDIKPSGKLQGSILRKLIRLTWNKGIIPFHEIVNLEYERINRNQEKYEKLLIKHPDKSKEWWFDTHGIEL